MNAPGFSEPHAFSGNLELQTSLFYLRRGMEFGDELELRARLWTVRVPRALFDRLPFPGDNRERLGPVPRHAALDEPAPDHHARAPDAPTAMHRANPPPLRIIAQRVEDLVHQPRGRGQAPVADGEAVVLDLGRGDAEERAARAEDARVGEELAALGEVDEGAHACAEEGVEFGAVGVFGGPGVFAGEEERGGPVGVGDGAGADGGEGPWDVVLVEDLQLPLGRGQVLLAARRGR